LKEAPSGIKAKEVESNLSDGRREIVMICDNG